MVPTRTINPVEARLEVGGLSSRLKSMYHDLYFES